jgi:hypothetical protein
LEATRRDGTRTRRAVTIAVRAIPPTATFTPTPVRRLPVADIRFWVDNVSVAAGSCTTLRWHVTNIKAYWVDGQAGSGDDGSRQVCPCQDETHVLHVVKSDGSQQDYQVSIDVKGTCVTPTPGRRLVPLQPLVPLLPLAPFVTPTATSIHLY